MSKTIKNAESKSNEKGIRFQCVAPVAQSVCLAGVFNTWNPTTTPMELGQGDEWHASVKLPPGKYEYKYIVDGIWYCKPDVTDEHYVGDDAVPNEFGPRIG